MIYIKFLFFIFFLTGFSTAYACKPGDLQKYIKFEENTSQMGADKALDLAMWFLYWRDDRGISYAIVFANSNKDDEKSQKLTDERLKNISKLLSNMAGVTRKIDYINSPIQAKSERDADYSFNTVEISIQPKCSETNSCCGGGGRR